MECIAEQIMLDSREPVDAGGNIVRQLHYQPLYVLMRFPDVAVKQFPGLLEGVIPVTPVHVGFEVDVLRNGAPAVINVCFSMFYNLTLPT